MKKLIFIILIFAVGETFSQEFPLIGAQVFIEPGQTEAETEGWFKTMRDNGMNVCRIRMFESYMKKSDGSWDFSLFDRAFRYAEKYDIKVMGTFFPATEETDIGGWKFPKDQQQLESFAEYIKQCVLHFKQFKSLYAWVLINEPGGGLRNNSFSKTKREEWLKNNPWPEETENGIPVLLTLQDHQFKRYMTSWMLNWIANEVRKHDKKIHLHVNNHAIFDNATEYDFPYWETFLNSLGGSAHASWHFGDFSRNQYALAMSANSEIMYSGSGNLPWLMTELQGGNNTYSGKEPMCPTPAEISQWLCIILGTEGKGGIFWTLNPRASGIEAGEWALLDFQNKPTGRVEAINTVVQCIKQNQDIFENFKKVDSKINLIYIKESIWSESELTKGNMAERDGRKIGMKNLLGYFMALSELGISPNIKAIEEFDFSEDNYEGTAIILANQIALPEKYVEPLERFVQLGGKLIVDGLTAYYNEYVQNWLLRDFPLKSLFGGTISEYRYIDEIEQYCIQGYNMPINVSKWKGILKPSEKSKAIAKDGNETLAIQSKFGNGEVFWIPSMLGLGAWEDSKPLAVFLMKELNINKQPFFFEYYTDGVLMKTLKSQDNYLTILINKSGKNQTIQLYNNTDKKKSSILYSTCNNHNNNDNIYIHSEETLVIEWN